MIFLLFSTSSIDMGYYNLVDKHDPLVKRAEENRFTFFNSQENTDHFPWESCVFMGQYGNNIVFGTQVCES